jgi:hypothetical protein
MSFKQTNFISRKSVPGSNLEWMASGLSKNPTSREEGGNLLDAWQEEGYSFM